MVLESVCGVWVLLDLVSLDVVTDSSVMFRCGGLLDWVCIGTVLMDWSPLSSS